VLPRGGGASSVDRDVRPLWPLCALALACAPLPSPRQPRPGEIEHIVAVQPDPGQRAGILLLQFHGELLRTGDLFAVLDENGYRGLVRTRRHASMDCDHCPGPLVEAELESGQGPKSVGTIAVGPVEGALPKARIERVARGAAPSATWRPTLQVDLDGDGKWDWVEVERCGHAVPTSCAGSGEVCDMFCTAVARAGKEPDPALMRCRSVVPDLEDCAP
jgi:hypothetical protein